MLAVAALATLAALAVAASSASAQSGTPSGPLSSLKAGKDGSKGRISIQAALPPGSSVTSKVLLGKRVLCRGPKTKAVVGGLTEIGCRFPLRALATKKSKSSQDGRYAPFVVLSIAVREVLLEAGTPIPADVPIALTIPITIAAFESDYQ